MRVSMSVNVQKWHAKFAMWFTLSLFLVFGSVQFDVMSLTLICCESFTMATTVFCVDFYVTMHHSTMLMGFGTQTVRLFCCVFGLISMHMEIIDITRICCQIYVNVDNWFTLIFVNCVEQCRWPLNNRRQLMLSYAILSVFFQLDAP